MKPLSSVCLIGPYPPPYGGVSVHVQRLHEYLREQGFPHTLYASNGLTRPVEGAVAGKKNPMWFLWKLLTCREEVVNLHSSRPALMALAGLILAARGRKSVGNLHGVGIPQRYDSSGPLGKWLFKAGLRRLSILLAANDSLRDFAVRELGMPAQRVPVVASFLPPLQASIERCQLPSAVEQFAKAHSPLFCATGCFGGYYKGEHTYGFNMLLPLLENMLSRRPDAGLAIAVNYVSDPNHRVAFLEEIQKRHLGGKVLVIDESLDEFAALLVRCDMFLRPSFTDGDALSVREALYFGVPTVASDCVQRPAGAILFKTGDAADLCLKVQTALADITKARQQALSGDKFHAGPVVVKYYKQLLRMTE